MTIKNITYKPDFLLLIFAFFLPILPQVSQVAIALYLISWIYNKQFRYLHKIKSNWFAIGSIAYWFIFALSGLYSENLTLWSSDLEAKLPLLIVPFLLVSRKHYNATVQKAIAWFFLSGCLVLTFFVFYQYFLGTGYTFRTTIGRITFLNPIYLAMFLSALLLIGLFFFFNRAVIKLDLKTFLQGLVLLVIHYTLFALASRMAIISTFLIEIGLILLWQFFYKKQYIRGALWLVVVIVFNLFSLHTIKQAEKRMLATSSTEVRALIWKASVIQIAKAPILGYGSGDARSVMAEGYEIVDYDYGIEHRQNCHNQYFETMISTGLIGLAILLAWLLLSFKTGWNTQNYLLCIFLAIIALNILTESMLERQQGTYFVAFFGSLLTWNWNSLRKE